MEEKIKRGHEFMDELDFKIIEELDRNSRIKNIEIAKKLCVSEGTVRRRIQELLESGLIDRFTIEFGVKRGLKAFVLIKYRPDKNPKAVLKFMKSLPQVKNVYQLTGKWDMIARMFTESSYDFNEVIDNIRSKPWVIETESLIVIRID